MNIGLIGRGTRAGYVRIPRDLDSIIATDPASESQALESGLSREAIDAIWKATVCLYRSGAYPAVGVCIRRRGRVILDRTIGHARGNGPRELVDANLRVMRPQTPACIFSASKAITATLMLKLIEDGGAALDDPVSRFIPEFAQHGKGGITIRHVLAHRGGFPVFHIEHSEVHAEMLLDWDGCIAMICDAPPKHSGPEKMAYHALTGGYILAEVIQRVTGQSLRGYHDKTLREPLGMTHFTFGLPPEHRGAVAHNYVAGMKVSGIPAWILQDFLMLPLDDVVEISNSDAFYEAVIPAGNLYCTGEELSRFYQMLLDEGRWQGRQVLKPETVGLLREPASAFALDHTLKLPMRYSMGMMLGANPYGILGPMSGQAFGHIGMMNVFGWADPSRQLSAALLTTGKAVLGAHLIPMLRWQLTLVRHCRA